MSKSYIEIEDFGNFENTIKKFDPAFNDVFKGLPAQTANFAQGEMSMVLRQGENKVKKPEKASALSVSDYEYYVLAKGE